MSVVVALWVPDFPVIVSGYWPRAAVLLAASVRELLPVVGLGAKDAVTPVGNPEMLKVTLPLNPYIAFTSAYTVVELPRPILTLP